MRVRVVLLLVAASCDGDPAREIRRCASTNLLADCCTSDDACRAYYSGERDPRPYCLDPGPEGICAACGADAHCGPGECCLLGIAHPDCAVRDVCD
jgi:hypothetical protein